MRHYAAVLAVFVAAALALGGCRHAPEPHQPAGPSLCEHPCDILNGVEPARLISCQMAEKLAPTCRPTK